MTEYVTTADALFFHKQLIERYGGAPGLRDAGALESALHRPQTGYYDTLVHEAAALLESLVQNHPFVDGFERGFPGARQPRERACRSNRFEADEGLIRARRRRVDRERRRNARSAVCGRRARPPS